MALPIRLIVGPDNIMEIPLDAQSLDIVVDRNASAFPTPNNVVGRVAIDTNIPAIGIEIDGVFQDDDSATFDIGKTTPQFGGGDIVFNFASALPTSNLGSALIYGDSTNVGTFGYYKVKFKAHFGISNEKTGFINNHDIEYGDVESTLGFGEFIGDVVHNITFPTRSAVNHPSAGTYSAGSTTIAIDSFTVGGSPGYHVNDRVHLADGTFVGTVTSRTNTALGFSGATKVALPDNTILNTFSTSLYASNGQVVGSVFDLKENSDNDITKLKLDEINVPIYENVDYYLVCNLTGWSGPPIEQLLNNKKISLYPNYWRIDRHTLPLSAAATWLGLEPMTVPVGVHLEFSTDVAHADYQSQTLGGDQIVGEYPTVISEGEHYPEYRNGRRIAGEGDGVRVKVPIGGITTHAVNGNPASTLALIVKKALELTTDVMEHGYITSSDGETLASAFTIVVSGPILKVKQKDEPIRSSYLSNIEPCLQPDASENFDFTNDSTKEQARIEFFTGSYNLNAVSVSGKSAGDKVQDLIGLVSNAKKDKDLIRGIQIPYDSLIQSDAVTPTARNFFLTFGQQDNDAKGSLGNTISASHHMVPQLLPGDLGGKTSPDNESSFFDNFGEIGDAVQAVGVFVGNFIGDTFITLTTDPHGNEGGMRIIPEKLHVRYDAGNNYYAFKLKLLASDFVIGV